MVDLIKGKVELITRGTSRDELNEIQKLNRRIIDLQRKAEMSRRFGSSPKDTTFTEKFFQGVSIQ